MPKHYKQDNWSNELVVGWSPAGKKMSMEAEDTVGIHHQATTGENPANWEDLVNAVVNCRMCELVIALVTCSYDLQVFNKSNYQSKRCL
jgi:hypothetical protein